jgi:hypothetical protein
VIFDICTDGRLSQKELHTVIHRVFTSGYVTGSDRGNYAKCKLMLSVVSVRGDLR